MDDHRLALLRAAAGTLAVSLIIAWIALLARMAVMS